LAVTVTGRVGYSMITGNAELSPYDATHPTPAAGRYTALGYSSVAPSGITTGAVLTARILANGAVTITGRRGLNGALGVGGQLLAGDRYPFYSQTLGAPWIKICGDISFNHTPSNPASAVTGSIHWTVPVALSAVTYYAAGGVDDDYPLTGCVYNPPVRPNAIFGGVNPTATLTVTYPSSTDGTPIPLTVSLNRPVDATGAMVYAFGGGSGSFTFIPSNGFFAGTYKTDRYQHPFSGVFMQGAPYNNRGVGTTLDGAGVGTATLAP
jgi:hypothetical protein